MRAPLDVARMDIGPEGVADFVWPVAREEVSAVRDAFLADIVPFLRGEAGKNRQADVIAVLLGTLLGEVLSIFRAQAAVRRLAGDGYAAEFPPQDRLYAALAAGAVPRLSGIAAMLTRGIARPPAWRRYGRILRRTLAPNLFAAPPARPDLSASIVTVAVGDMIQQHAAAIDEPVYFQRFEEWFAPLGAQDKPAFGGVPRAAFLDSTMDIVGRAFAAGHEPLLDHSARYLREWMLQVGGLTDRYLARLFAMPLQIPKRLWRGTGGNLFARLLSYACREMGGHVTGHDHAHGQGPWRTYSDTAVEIPGCDRFLVWTELQRTAALRNLRADLLVEATPPEIAVVPGVFRPAIPHAPAPKSARPRSVMYVGTLYEDDFVAFTPLDPACVLVDFEARLIAKLKGWGFEVLVKPHPESPIAAPAAYAERLGATIVTDRFEDCYQGADIILFGQPNATAFFNVLATSKPIVVADTGLRDWHPEARALLDQRCGVVIGRRSADNRIEMNWDALHSAIERAPGLMDDGFYAAYMRGDSAAVPVTEPSREYRRSAG